MGRKPRPVEDLSIWEDAQAMLCKARRERIETAWDRADQQHPPCSYCRLGTSCQACAMGPCRINTGNAGSRDRGVCGADADVIVARNFGRFVAGGAASHSDHGRDLIEVLEAVVAGESEVYGIGDEAKLRALAKE